MGNVNEAQWDSGDGSEEIKPAGDHLVRGEEVAGEEGLGGIVGETPYEEKRPHCVEETATY